MREKHKDTSSASVFGKYFYDTRHRKYIARKTKKKQRERDTRKKVTTLKRQAKGKNKLEQFKWKIEEDWFVLARVLYTVHTVK